MKRQAILLCTVGAIGCGGKGDSGVATKPVAAIAVETAVATEGDVPQYVTVTGTVLAEKSANVTTLVPGRVVAVLTELGQSVKAGQPLVQLDTSTAALGALEAQAQLRAAQAQRLNAEVECQKAKELFDKGAISQSQYERERVGCVALEETVAAAQARTRSVAKNVNEGVIRAPFDGIISARRVNVGEWVAPGMPLVHVVDEDPLRLELAVPELYTAKIAKGQVVEFSVAAFGEQVFTAQVARLGGEVGRMTRSMTVEADVKPGSGVRAGMFADANIVVGTNKLPMVPDTAVVKRGASWRVFVVQSASGAGGGTQRVIEERVVERGPKVGDLRGIVSGVAAGETVVRAPGLDVVDGAPVQ